MYEKYESKIDIAVLILFLTDLKMLETIPEGLG